MKILAIDTALEACSAAVLDGGRVLAARREPMTRGHQERLAPLVAEAMAEAGLAFAELDRLGVTIGPGSFTGLRVGLAFAKGLALALEIPCVGVGALEALAASAADAPDAVTGAAIDARRGQVYLQAFHGRQVLGPPEVLEHRDACRRLVELAGEVPLRLLGSGAMLLTDELPRAAILSIEVPDPVVVARLAAAAPAPTSLPRLLYLRAPDARLPA